VPEASQFGVRPVQVGVLGLAVFCLVLPLGLTTSGVWMFVVAMSVSEGIDLPTTVGTVVDGVFVMSLLAALMLAWLLALRASTLLAKSQRGISATLFTAFGGTLAWACLGWLLGLWIALVGVLPHPLARLVGGGLDVWSMQVLGDTLAWAPMTALVCALLRASLGLVSKRVAGPGAS
jgi:hypothetical protein